MVEKAEKIKASLMLASYLETVGFKNGLWEFNYNIKVNNNINNAIVSNKLLYHFLIIGGPSNIDITGWNSSDDTIMILATAKAIIDGGGEENYKKRYLEYFDLLLEEKRVSGINTLDTLKLLKQGATIKTLHSNQYMRGNGAAMRTGPIGLIWYDNIEKVIEESIIASRLTHNYYIGYLGGMVTALFTAYAMLNIPPWEWCNMLISLYNKKIIHKYYPKEHNINDLVDFMGYWKRYSEIRLVNLKYKNTLDNFINYDDRIEFLLSFHPDPTIKEFILNDKNLKNFTFNWSNIGNTGLDVCIFAYDCLLMSINTPNSKILDFNNIVYSCDTFMTLVAIHPGDNDTTASIGGSWFGALLGFNGFDKNKMKQLEFYKDLEKISSNLTTF